MRRNIFLILCCLFVVTASGKKAYTLEDVWLAYDGFNRCFLDKNKYIYKTDTSFPEAVDRWNGAAAIWCQPVYWDMAMNAYKLACRLKDKTREEELKVLCYKIFEGNKAQYVHFDFHDNNENTGWFIYDDIQWWTISLARAYLLFGNQEFLNLAEASFSRVWYGSDKVGDTGSFDEKNGGMFWQWHPIQQPEPNCGETDGKMACINFPTVVAAMTLSRCVPDNRQPATGRKPLMQSREQYVEKARQIYEWGVNNLFDRKTGKVADSRHGTHEPAWVDHVYNQGTFIGASVLLYQETGEQVYLDNAIAAADYTVGPMSEEYHLLPFEGGIEQGIYTAIFAQYMSLLVYECKQYQYLPFLENTILTGWNNRDRVRTICGGRYEKKLSADERVDSYSASGIPALMLLFPASE